jgi:hypothetical protein
MMQPSPIRRLLRRLDKTWASIFSLDQWVIMTALDADFRSLRWPAFRPLVPDKDRYWGDPFILQRGGKYYVFVEEKIYAMGRGHIACLILDGGGRFLERRVVLERDYHLSYPFLFEHRGETYMLPETAANGTIEAFRCTGFPEEWEHARTLMQGLYAVDATLLKGPDRYWLFANVKDPGGSSLDALHLFWANDPLSDSWTPHPKNPVVRDIASARPAGAIITQGSELFRPAQDSTRRYGYALKFNRIMTLNEEDYAEQTVAVFNPDGRRTRATHTFNQAGGLTVIDAVVRRPR